MDSKTRLGISQPYSYQAAVDNLSGGFLHLPQLGDEVPEARLGHHMVWGEDPHAVQRGCGVFSRGQETPNNLILPKLKRERETHSEINTNDISSSPT